MIYSGQNRSTGTRTVPVPLCSPHISHSDLESNPDLSDEKNYPIKKHESMLPRKPHLSMLQTKV